MNDAGLFTCQDSAFTNKIYKITYTYLHLLIPVTPKLTPYFRQDIRNQYLNFHLAYRIFRQRIVLSCRQFLH